LRKSFEILLAGAGVVLFAFVARRIGWDTLIHALAQARIAVAFVIVLGLARLVLQTRSWQIALRSDGIETSPTELLFIRMASQAVGYLSVLGPVASEPMKIGLLHKSAKPVAATLVDSGIYWFTSGLIGIAGCIAAGLVLAHSPGSIAALTISATAIALTLLLITRSKSYLAPLTERFGRRCPEFLKKMAGIEKAIHQFRDQHPGSIRRMMALDFACQALLAAEVVVILWFLKIPPQGGLVLAIEGATRAIKIMSGWMPARIGADESGLAGVFLAFGLAPASGMTLALARRSRDLFAALIGLSWLAWKSAVGRGAKSELSTATLSQ
jgi:hypothetical protein